MRTNPPKVINALLRVEGVAGNPPAHWERPNEKLNFWVLELHFRNEPLDKWIATAILTIKAHKQNLTQFKNQGWKTFLFVATKSEGPVRFEAELLALLGRCGVTLEHSQE